MDIGSLDSYFNQYQSTLQTSKTADDISKMSQKGLENAGDDELMDVCKQFESYFIEQMYKAMVKTIPQNEEMSGSTSTMMDYYKDQMLQSIADQTTEQSGFGLAQMLYEQMRRNYGLDAASIQAETEE